MSSNKGKDSGDSDNAVDGIFYETCSHTSNGKKTWWTVDLGDLYNVTGVVIQSNTDCCGRYIRAYPGSEFIVANTLAKWKKLEPNEINFSQGFSQKVESTSCFCIFTY